MLLGRRAKRVLLQLVRALHIRVGRLADQLDDRSQLTAESAAQPGIEDEAQRAPDTAQGTGGPPAHWVNLVRRHAPQLLRPPSTGHHLPTTIAPSKLVRHPPATAMPAGNQTPKTADEGFRWKPQREPQEHHSGSPVRQPVSMPDGGAGSRRAAQPVAAGDASPPCAPVVQGEPRRAVPPSVSPALDSGTRRPLSASQASAPCATHAAPTPLQPNRSERVNRARASRTRTRAETAALTTGTAVFRDPKEALEPRQNRPVSPWLESALPTGGRSAAEHGARDEPHNGSNPVSGTVAPHADCAESHLAVGHSGDAGIAPAPQPPVSRAPLASLAPLSPVAEHSGTPRTQTFDPDSQAANKEPGVSQTSPFAGDADSRPVFSVPLWPRLADEQDSAAKPGGAKPNPWPSLPDEAARQVSLARSEALRAVQQQERVMQRRRDLDLEQKGGLWNA